jgi:hypothetical protein
MRPLNGGCKATGPHFRIIETLVKLSHYANNIELNGEIIWVPRKLLKYLRPNLFAIT